jgi:hypothetical protein
MFYTAASGSREKIPLGACLLEQVSRDYIDVFWGVDGQISMAFPIAVVKAAYEQGSIVLLSHGRSLT